MVSGDFEKADQEAGVATLDKPRTQVPAVFEGGTSEYRDKLVERYHQGAPTLVQRLANEGHTDTESLLLALIDEVVRETDNLLGNQIISTENGDLRDSSVISYKRAEVLEKAIKAVQSKREFERQEGVDLDSPSMVVVFQFFLAKVKETFEVIDLPTEQRDMFFAALGEQTENWKKELREEFENMSAR